METSLNRGIEKYSVDFTGRALANFVNLAKVTYSNIGNYSSSVKGGKKDIVASGHQIFDMNDKNIMNSPVTIYTFTSRTILDKSLVFQNEFGTKTSLILSNILDKTELEQQVKDELLQKLRDIDSKKCLVIPVRPQSDYKVSVEVNNQKKTKMPAKVRYIKWSTNKDNYKLDCVVGFDVDTGDAFSYGLVVSAKVEGSDMRVNSSYTYMANGERYSTSVSGNYNASRGSAVKISGSLMKPDGLYKINQVTGAISTFTADRLVTGGKTYLISDRVSCYKINSSVSDEYSMISLNEIIENKGRYNITAYYDKSSDEGGRVRVIVVTENNWFDRNHKLLYNLQK